MSRTLTVVVGGDDDGVRGEAGAGDVGLEATEVGDELPRLALAARGRQIGRVIQTLLAGLGRRLMGREHEPRGGLAGERRGQEEEEAWEKRRRAHAVLICLVRRVQRSTPRLDGCIYTRGASRAGKRAASLARVLLYSGRSRSDLQTRKGSVDPTAEHTPIASIQFGCT